ncbi:DUF3757 domain-containing protein [Pseudomonas caricapapayae]|uniref:DUF3757 domain-containing protein n=1 Tax=Pseudomonas caricapapayae TaxID=46678 RepID=UPI000EFEEC46|nr:DUF3757 domain-containing protein [Pseudomonas caricapapayae]
MMNRIFSAMTGSCLLLIAAAAQASESCPVLSKIQQDNASGYTASGENGQWRGTSSTEIEKNLKVLSFKLATVTQESDSAPQRLQYCEYTIEKDNKLNMRFIGKDGKDVIVKTEGNYWKKEDGYFGMINHVCEEIDPEKCTFTLVK